MVKWALILIGVFTLLVVLARSMPVHM